MNKSHTPGPWTYNARLSASENHKGYYIKCQRFVLADVIPVDTDGIEGKANALLIAAAPELLDVADGLLAVAQVGVLNDPEWFGRIIGLARAATKKARGES